MNNILVISIENKNTKTEEIYFRNKKNKWSDSFNRDNRLKSLLGIRNIFFISFDFSSSNKKIKSKIECLKNARPYICECYIFCDNDYDSWDDNQIESKMDYFKKIISDTKVIEEKFIFKARYKNPYNNFESFLEMHLPKNIKTWKSKTDKDIYLKTMGKNHENYYILLKNICKIDRYGNINKIFSKRIIEYET